MYVGAAWLSPERKRPVFVYARVVWLFPDRSSKLSKLHYKVNARYVWLSPDRRVLPVEIPGEKKDDKEEEKKSSLGLRITIVWLLSPRQTSPHPGCGVKPRVGCRVWSTNLIIHLSVYYIFSVISVFSKCRLVQYTVDVSLFRKHQCPDSYVVVF